MCVCCVTLASFSVFDSSQMLTRSTATLFLLSVLANAPSSSSVASTLEATKITILCFCRLLTLCFMQSCATFRDRSKRDSPPICTLDITIKGVNILFEGYLHWECWI